MYRSRFTVPAIKVFMAAFILSLAPNIAGAACHVVTPNGSGAKSGADWNNAYADVPTGSLVRGDTYYVATGNYGSSLTFNTSPSGTSLVTIKKAASTDHCTDTGWNGAYGTGQAVYNTWYFNIANLTIDGSYNSGTPGSYGFLVNKAGGEGHALEFDNGTSSNITVRNTEMQGPGLNHVYSTDGRAINMETTTVSTADFNNDSMHDYETVISIFNASNVTIENSKIFNNNAGNPSFDHPNVYQTCNTSGTMVFRNNDVTTWSTEGIMFCPSNAGATGTWYIYNNVWHDPLQVSNYPRVLEPQYSPAGPIFFFNNTIVNTWIALNTTNGGSYASGSLGRNNIYWNDAGGTGIGNDANDLVGSGSSSPFVSLGSNYQLKAANGTGANLSSNCSGVVTSICQDILGNVRPSSGSWDVGAYEFGTSASVNPPTNLQVISVQ